MRQRKIRRAFPPTEDGRAHLAFVGEDRTLCNSVTVASRSGPEEPVFEHNQDATTTCRRCLNVIATIKEHMGRFVLWRGEYEP